MRSKKSIRMVDEIINTTNTPINVYTAEGQIITLEANRAFTGSRAGVLFLTKDFVRNDTVAASYAGKGRDNMDIWELHDKEGSRIYPRRG